MDFAETYILYDSFGFQNIRVGMYEAHDQPMIDSGKWKEVSVNSSHHPVG